MIIGICMCAFDWHQDRWPWMTLNWYKFEFSENFARFRRFGDLQTISNTATVKPSVGNRISLICWKFPRLWPSYTHCCRALTFASGQLACNVIGSTVHVGHNLAGNTACIIFRDGQSVTIRCVVCFWWQRSSAMRKKPVTTVTRTASTVSYNATMSDERSLSTVLTGRRGKDMATKPPTQTCAPRSK